jgi:hypothetical protein
VKKTDFRAGNFERNSDGLDAAGLKRLLPGWVHDPKVRCVVVDKDFKPQQEILISGWNVEYKVDVNHAVKILVRF